MKMKMVPLKTLTVLHCLSYLIITNVVVNMKMMVKMVTLKILTVLHCFPLRNRRIHFHSNRQNARPNTDHF